MTAEEILADYFCDCGLAGRGAHKSFCHSREANIAKLVGEVEQAITEAVAKERERIIALIKTAHHYGIDELIDPEEIAIAIRKVKP